MDLSLYSQSLYSFLLAVPVVMRARFDSPELLRQNLVEFSLRVGINLLQLIDQREERRFQLGVELCVHQWVILNGLLHYYNMQGDNN